MGELAEWLEYNSQLYLERVLNWLLVGLQDRRLASAAATALQNVCSNCQRHMAPHLQVSIASLKMPSNQWIFNINLFNVLFNILHLSVAKISEMENGF